MMIKQLLSTSALVGVLLTATPSMAEEAASADDAGIQDIIVTAQRRAENLQKSSISIEVLSPEEIAKAGVTQARDLATAIAGVQIGQAGGATQIYIRGVGDFGSTATTNPAVAFNVDGVYVARPAGVDGNFFDVERVEVLKGPQGTLYGRNATGGAINVITQKPKLGVREMAGAIEVGNFDRVSAEAAVNLPLGETTAIRVAGQIIHRGPYVSNNFDDDIHQSVRGQLLWKPSDALSIRVGADYTHVGGGGAGYVLLQQLPGVDPWTSVTDSRITDLYNQRAVASGLCAPRFPPVAPFPPSPGGLVAFSGACPNLTIPGGPLAGTYTEAQLVKPATGARGRTNNEFYSIFGQLDYDMGPVTLTVLPAYRSTSLDYETYPALLRFDISVEGKPETSKATSLEVRLSHDSGALKAVLGGYYFNEDQKANFQVDAGFVQNIVVQQKINTRSYAAFGQANLSLADSFRLIGGARYTSDRRQINSLNYNLLGSGGFFGAVGAGACVPGPVPGATSFIGCLQNTLIGSKTFTKFNWKVGAEFDLGPQSMVYATASTGFKAGGFYSGVAPSGVGVGTYNPEQLTAFEIGSRNRFFDNKLQLNFEGFYYDYKDHQEAVIITDGAGQTTQAILNAGQGRVFGASADLVFKPSRNDTFHVGVEYLDTKYSTFQYSSPIIVGADGNPQRFIPGAGLGTGCGLSERPFTASFGQTGALPSAPNAQRIFGFQDVNCGGQPLTRSPKFAGVASYMHNFELASGGGIEAEGNMQFQSSRIIATDYLPISKVGAYAKFNASLTYRAPNDIWSLSAYVRNITNEVVYDAGYRANFVTGFNAASIQAPRTYGARLNFKF
jgi:iron complex outermembrane recepter protein